LLLWGLIVSRHINVDRPALVLEATLKPAMSKGVESVSLTAFPAAAVMDELSEVQLLMGLSMVVSVVTTVLNIIGGDSACCC
jgi:hypothetical protein